MTALDTNLLVYAHRKESPFHEAARNKLKSLAEAPATWAIPWPCIHEFLAVVTHGRIFKNPSSHAQAWDFLEALMESPTLVLLSETSGHGQVLRSLLNKSRVTGPRVHDARIAALCLEHAVTVLWTADRDLSRFHPLKCHNPLVVADGESGNEFK